MMAAGSLSYLTTALHCFVARAVCHAPAQLTLGAAETPAKQSGFRAETGRTHALAELFVRF